MKSQIALIGTEGSGKTVLTTVLAKKLATMQDGGIWLDPQGSKTAKYVAENWNTLCGGEWLPSTPAGILFDLHWKMRAKNGECPMRIIDSAGQDLRRLFRDDGFRDPDLTDQDRQFIKYIADSTILLVLVNLRDFLGEPDKNKVIENSLILKDVLDEMQKNGKKRQIAFIFPAYDLYRETIQKKYGAAEQFLAKELPFLYNAYVSDKSVKCFAVAAVADTEVKRDNRGKSWRVPTPNFSSNGIKPLIQWLAKAVASDIEEQKKYEKDRQKKHQRQTLQRKIKSGLSNAFNALITIIIVLFLLWMFVPKLLTEVEKLYRKKPQPEQLDILDTKNWK